MGRAGHRYVAVIQGSGSGELDHRGRLDTTLRPSNSPLDAFLGEEPHRLLGIHRIAKRKNLAPYSQPPQLIKPDRTESARRLRRRHPFAEGSWGEARY